MVDRDRQIGKTPPAVARRRVCVRARRVAAVGQEAADDDDLPAEGSSGDLRPRDGQRLALLPGDGVTRAACRRGRRKSDCRDSRPPSRTKPGPAGFRSRLVRVARACPPPRKESPDA